MIKKERQMAKLASFPLAIFVTAAVLSGCSFSLTIPGAGYPPATTLAAPDYTAGLNSIAGALSYEGRQPPYRLYPGGTSVKLVNNPAAVDVTWNRLMAFVESDATDRNAYIPDRYMCGSFAMDLHNDAEAAGIRAAWVAIDFFGQDVGHAATAFMTTDRGLVIIDDTSSYDVARQDIGDSLANGFDKVAYIAIGQDYGVVPLEVASSPLYNYYLSYLDNFRLFEQKRDAYEADAAAYEQALGGRTRLKEPEYTYFNNWHDRLQAEQQELNVLGDSLGDYYWESLGVVAAVKIYW
ncbi:hypothetical protein Dform_00034 [Dehalogenimonas formicexedens]|uniref:Uncharacterized protein n=1 Tax=Dehalogenimonas formicexedens TaxID=1839801 RepID=A0A1P8F4J9_9CHLR|nr:hypothetical protein [Dehalogenimonas formicexedens]APV43399.1 hypothetical protein Dform_00034 [Dehalogenimonas formicexedens]